MRTMTALIRTAWQHDRTAIVRRYLEIAGGAFVALSWLLIPIVIMWGR